MTHPAVDRARELDALATPGPWLNGYDDGSGRADERNGADISCPAQEDGRSQVINGGHDDWGVQTGVITDVDAEFIAAARTLLPELVEAYETLEAVHLLDDEEREVYTDHRDRVVALNTRLTVRLDEQADELLNRDGECVELQGQVERLTAALRSLSDKVLKHDNEQVGWCSHCNGYAEAARALLAETEKT